jgi:hypothetical protein
MVAAPMVYTSVACAISYLIPAALLRAIFGVQLPLVSVALLLVAMAAVSAACGWATRKALTRTVALVVAYHLVIFLVRGLLPIDSPPGVFSLSARPEQVELNLAGYALIAALCAAAYGAALWGVARQRHGAGGGNLPQAPHASDSANKSPPIVDLVRRASTQVAQWRCPTSSPTAAALWLEVQARGAPVAGVGIVLAVLLPTMLVRADAAVAGIALVIVVILLAVPFLLNISASIWNRRSAWGAEVSPFEAARPVGSAQLIAVQVLVGVACIGAAYVLIAAGLWVAAKLFANAIGLIPVQKVIAAIGAISGMRLAAAVVVDLVLFSTAICFLTALRALSVLYGRRLWLAMLAVALYSLALVAALITDHLDGAVISAHLWAVAIAIPIGTVMAFAGALRDRVLTPRHVVTALVLWLAFAALYLGVFLDVSTAANPAALNALVIASGLLPAWAVALAPWSFSWIRHA